MKDKGHILKTLANAGAFTCNTPKYSFFYSQFIGTTFYIGHPAGLVLQQYNFWN